ncbi:hypothetical protein EDD29_6777 [Actinocorallia herbida]|uniref:Uncharacterized protein n=1 Tax=Actinocorallia herbida TaxID=58109 RepID=A0A3N1D6D8_9ACTN|nr:hypothetical protein [Actinocorallia herbida]ROO89090.1 hypothetical protein EDD29_6777 [Actinocorallia herbida]
MPSPRHDSLNSIFRRRPELALEILHDLCGAAIDSTVLARVESNDFNTRPSDDFTPDTVIVAGPPQSPTLGVIVEIQYEKSERKRRQLARYAMQLCLLLDRPAHVLVIAPTRSAAVFYETPLVTILPGYTFRPHVVGSETIPVIADPAEAAAHIDLSALSVMAHGAGNRKVVTAFMAAIESIPREKGNSYTEHCWNISPLPVRKIMEEIMKTNEWPAFSPFAREHFGKGRAEGHAEGEVDGLARSILLVLDSRGLAVDGQVRARIEECREAEVLEKWLMRAATASVADEVFADDPLG